jgi:hypothetical protein
LPEGLNEEELEAKPFGNQPVQAGAVDSGQSQTGKSFISNCNIIV